LRALKRLARERTSHVQRLQRTLEEANSNSIPSSPPDPNGTTLP
jgi:hypothetical protein